MRSSHVIITWLKMAQSRSKCYLFRIQRARRRACQLERERVLLRDKEPFLRSGLVWTLINGGVRVLHDVRVGRPVCHMFYRKWKPRLALEIVQYLRIPAATRPAIRGIVVRGGASGVQTLICPFLSLLSLCCSSNLKWICSFVAK